VTCQVVSLRRCRRTVAMYQRLEDGPLGGGGEGGNLLEEA